MHSCRLGTQIYQMFPTIRGLLSFLLYHGNKLPMSSHLLPLHHLLLFWAAFPSAVGTISASHLRELVIFMICGELPLQIDQHFVALCLAAIRIWRELISVIFSPLLGASCSPVAATVTAALSSSTFNAAIFFFNASFSISNASFSLTSSSFSRFYVYANPLCQQSYSLFLSEYDWIAV